MNIKRVGNELNAKLIAPSQARPEARLSLIFKPGQRPAAADVAQLVQAGRRPVGQGEPHGFSISYQPQPDCWLELLANGMTFELSGLASSSAAPMPAIAHFYGISSAFAAMPVEAITLTPGDQFRGMDNLLPVVRIMVGLAARLVELADVIAVVWHPARCAVAPDIFAAAIARWLSGGPFPALGLTAIASDDDGAIRSEGLAFFIENELWIDPLLSKNTTEKVKIATRLINLLVGIGPLHQPFETTGPNGEHLSVEPPGNDGLLKVWGKT